MSHEHALVDHLFRECAGQMVSALTRVLGPDHLDIAEEVVQDALVKALQTWPYRGVPANPRGWLFSVARNGALDIVRRDALLRKKLEPVFAIPTDIEVGYAEEAFGDDELAMVLMCCHTDLPRDARVALTLKTAGAFSVREIAAAFLCEPATIAQRIVRAKRTIVEQEIRFELPRGDELRARLDSVLDVLYLLFNEGYNAHEGESLVRQELCHEAIRLARLLTRRDETDIPRLHALLALMLLQASRLSARTDETGMLLLLAEQDRSRWDRTLISAGMRFLESSAAGDEVSTYHIQAGIAAAHAVAADESSTDWALILRLYDDLSAIAPSPVVELNRAVAIAMVKGPTAGIRALEMLRAHPALARYYLLPAILAGLWLRAGDSARAAACYGEALGLSCTSPERRFMQRKLAECTAHGAPAQ